MSNVTRKDFNGIAISFEGKEKISLTDLWKAAGAERTSAPNFWIEQEENSKFISAVARSVNATVDCIIKTKRGKGGGTWAHWQIALAYAKYLSPELHLFVNQCFVDHLEEERNNEVLATRIGGSGNIYAMCSDATNKAIIGKSAQEYKITHNLPKNASIRDNMSTIELLQIALAEEVSAERIVENNIFGNIACANVHTVIGDRIHNAVTMRGV